MPTGAGQPTERGRRSRARLLDAAEQELLDRGRIEVTRVAERAGASLGLLYRYFDGKDGLVAAVVHRFYDRYDAAIFAAPSRPDVGWFPQERSRLEREVAFLFAEPLARPLVGGAPQEPAAAHADAQRLRRHIELAARNIAHGQRRGEVAPSVDPSLAAAAFIGALRASLAIALAEGSAVTPSDVTETVWRVGEAVIVPTGE